MEYAVVQGKMSISDWYAVQTWISTIFVLLKDRFTPWLSKHLLIFRTCPNCWEYSRDWIYSDCAVNNKILSKPNCCEVHALQQLTARTHTLMMHVLCKRPTIPFTITLDNKLWYLACMIYQSEYRHVTYTTDHCWISAYARAQAQLQLHDLVGCTRNFTSTMCWRS